MNIIGKFVSTVAGLVVMALFAYAGYLYGSNQDLRAGLDTVTIELTKEAEQARAVTIATIEATLDMVRSERDGREATAEALEALLAQQN